MPRPADLAANGRRALVIVIAVALVLGWMQVLPVRSQTQTVRSLRAAGAVPMDDPWATIWDSAETERITMSAQEVAPPFGGTVQSLTVRSLYDDDRVYVVVEWVDDSVDDSVAGAEAFSDAAALQFPGQGVALAPYTMGGVGAPVNIWHWKAAWERDIAEGYTTSRSVNPDTLVDEFPAPDDPDLFHTARAAGNPLAQQQHASPVENLVAEGFGSLTHATVQDVAGSGVWREGRWRVLFARSFAPDDDSPAQALFGVGESTQVAFAVWDGDVGERNGQKSIAQFVDLRLDVQTAPPPGIAPGDTGGGGSPFIILGAVVAIFVVALIGFELALKGPGSRTT